MSRNDAFNEGAGKHPGKPPGAAPRPLTERYPMLFDPQYDAPEGHLNYSASNAISGEINEGHQSFGRITPALGYPNPVEGSSYPAHCGSTQLHGFHRIITERGHQSFCNGNRGEPIVEQPVEESSVVRRYGQEGVTPSEEARNNTKVWGLFHDPHSYAAPELHDAEPFTSITHAKNVLRHRISGGDSFYPAVSNQAEMHLYLGHHPAHMNDPYPDRIIKAGPRGGVKVERA